MTADTRLPAGAAHGAKLRREDVDRIARETARNQSPPLDVVGVTGHADTSYVEVLFADPMPHRDQALLIGLFRDSGEQALRADLERKLQLAGATHKAGR